MQGRRSPRYTAAVAAISLHCLQAEAAAFSTSHTFSQRRERYSSLTSARPQSLLEGAVARDIIGSASSTLDESRGGRGPLHQPCQQPLTMSMDELLTIGKTESRFMPMRRGAYQKVQTHMNATGALIHNVVKSEAWAAYKTTTVMERNQVRPHDNQPNLSLRSID